MKKFLSVALISLLSMPLSQLMAEEDKTLSLGYYLPQASNYDPSIPTPSSSLGYQVGEWHVRPEQIAYYFEKLANASNRVKVEVIGYSHEKRPLILAYISSPENLQKLEQLRVAHVKNEKAGETPLFTWMGYSVHGNEASGSNASLLFAYHYAAANDKATLAQLDKQVIIVDPMLNPDGLSRFASWVNRYKSKTPNADPLDT
ncbi:MAG: M14 family zinc carboxypeptidase, partial [Kangiellaceae bacterium]|nr:M14 family zinc carboxypeptidase [Kangiellaceae bacterium]